MEELLRQRRPRGLAQRQRMGTQRACRYSCAIVLSVLLDEGKCLHVYRLYIQSVQRSEIDERGKRGVLQVSQILKQRENIVELLHRARNQWT